MNKLYCLPLGETMRGKFIEDAKQFAYGQALFVVPGHVLMDEVKKTGSVRTVIMDYLPNELLRANNLEIYTRISRPAQEMVIKQIIKDLAAKGELVYFSKLADKKGFIKNMVSFIGELSRGGITCEELYAALQAWERPNYLRAKDFEVYNIYQLYRQELKKQNKYDVDGLYRLAIKTLQADACVVPWEKLYFSEFYQFDNLQIELLKALSKHCTIDVGLFYDTARPELSVATENAYVDFMGMGFTKQLVQEFSPRTEGLEHFTRNWQNNAASVGAATGISVFEAYSIDNEMRGVLGRIKKQLQAGVSCKDIICIVRSMEEYNGFSNLFKEFGIPTTLPEVTGFSAQPLAKFIGKIMNSAVAGYQIDLWKELLDDVFLDKIFGIDHEKFEESYNEKYFAAPRALQVFAEEMFPQSKIGELFAFIASLKGTNTPADFANSLLLAMDSWHLETVYGEAYKAGNITLAQLKAVVTTKNMVEEIFSEMVAAFEQSGQGKQKRPISEFLEFWEEQAKEKIITLTLGDKNGVKVVEASTIQGIVFPYVYILGMREGQFPKVKFENWIYNDQERKALNELGVTLPLTADTMKIDQYFFASVTAMAQKALTFSYYSDDVASASCYLQELQQYYPKAALTPIFSTTDVRQCFSADELIGILAQQEKLADTEEAWLTNKVGNDFGARKALDKSRWSEKAIFNGYLGQKRQCKYLSASALDNYVQCPFNYMVTNIWQTRPWEPLEKETQPAVIGDLYHLSLAKFLNKHLEENIGNADNAALLAELMHDLSAAYKELITKCLISESEFSKYEYKRYQTVLEKWLLTEQAYQAKQKINLLPKYLELAFGREGSKLPGLSIYIDEEETIFSGQIDRVDTDGNKYMLTDYKSGLVPSGKAVALGKSLQLPVYILAMENLLSVPQEQILGAGYYALKSYKRVGGLWENNFKEDLPWLYNTRPNNLTSVMEKAQESIATGIRGIRNSVFPANPAEKCPSYCPCKDICRYRVSDGMQDVGEEGEDNV
jgi:ATP-dependent helicase/nuclease subunit B